jgi:hypothetical protein
LAPTVIFDDIVTFLSASSTGTTPNRTLTFYKDSLSEASVQRHIDGASAYIHWFIGDALWNTQDPVGAPIVSRLLLLYACTMVLSVLCGGLIVSGFNIVMSDLSLQRSERFNVYHDLIADFSGEAESLAMQMTQFTLAKAGGKP